MAQIRISNRYLDNVKWDNARACDFVIGGKVDVWRICIVPNLPLLDEFLSIMRPGEIARANRYFHVKDKNRYIVSRGALRNILGKYLNQAPAAVEFGIGENKKPYILNTGKTDLNYNISHSEDWVLLSIANSEIGADTEPINEAFDYREIVSEYFSRDEIKYINECQSFERFFTLWTRKEALTKATGKGLDDKLKFIPSLDGVHFTESNIISSTDDWSIISFKLHEQHIGSVANNTAANEIRFWDIDLNI